MSALLDCPRLLIVGYGGADDHIGTWLWQWRRAHGDRARLVWVTQRRDMREPRQDLRFPQYAAGNGESTGIRYITADDVARGELRTVNAYVMFTGSPLGEEVTDCAIDF